MSNAVVPATSGYTGWRSAPPVPIKGTKESLLSEYNNTNLSTFIKLSSRAVQEDGQTLTTIIDEYTGGEWAAIGDDTSTADVPVMKELNEVVLVQPASVLHNQELEGAECKFYSPNITPENGGVRSVLHLIPLAILEHGRVYFPPYSGKSGEANRPICSSSNGLYPDAHIENPISEQCGVLCTSQKTGLPYVYHTCPHAQWGANKEKPNCRDYITVMFFDLDAKVPVKMTFRGALVRKINDLCKKIRGMRTVMQLKRQSIFDYMVVATAGKSGSYATMDMTFEPVSGDYEGASKYAPVIKHYLSNLFKYGRISPDENKHGDAVESAKELQADEVAVSFVESAKSSGSAEPSRDSAAGSEDDETVFI